MFSSLRQGNSIYILDKTDIPKLKVGQVVNVSTPTPVYGTQTSGVMVGMQPRMEISIRAKVDGTEGDFAHLATDQSVKDYGNMIVCDNREAMMSEVDTIKQLSQRNIDNHDKDKSIVLACDDIFKSLNPNYAKEQERDTAIESLNEKVNGIESQLAQILKAVTKNKKD